MEDRASAGASVRFDLPLSPDLAPDDAQAGRGRASIWDLDSSPGQVDFDVQIIALRHAPQAERKGAVRCAWDYELYVTFNMFCARSVETHSYRLHKDYTAFELFAEILRAEYPRADLGAFPKRPNPKDGTDCADRGRHEMATWLANVAKPSSLKNVSEVWDFLDVSTAMQLLEPLLLRLGKAEALEDETEACRLEALVARQEKSKLEAAHGRLIPEVERLRSALDDGQRERAALRAEAESERIMAAASERKATAATDEAEALRVRLRHVEAERDALQGAVQSYRAEAEGDTRTAGVMAKELAATRQKLKQAEGMLAAERRGRESDRRAIAAAAAGGGGGGGANDDGVASGLPIIIETSEICTPEVTPKKRPSADSGDDNGGEGDHDGDGGGRCGSPRLTVGVQGAERDACEALLLRAEGAIEEFMRLSHIALGICGSSVLKASTGVDWGTWRQNVADQAVYAPEAAAAVIAQEISSLTARTTALREEAIREKAALAATAKPVAAPGSPSTEKSKKTSIFRRLSMEKQ